MSLDMVSCNKSTALDGMSRHGADSIFDLAAHYRIEMPQMTRLEEAYYKSPQLTSAEQIAAFIKEVSILRKRHSEAMEAKFLKCFASRGKISQFARERAIELAQQDPWIVRLEEILSVCQDALDSDKTLRLVSD